VDHFALEYGINSNNYQYAADNIGGNGTNIYTVNYLNPNTTYYFRVRAGNGCATGSWSNEISAKTKGFVSFNQLDLSSQLLTVPAEQVQPVGTSGSCQTYTVKPNDNLWSIAMTLLGDGNKYKDIITENSNSYPTLKTSNNVSVGWELKINCSSEANKSSETTTTTNTPTGGYKVNIKVKDTKGNSIENATVTIHSTPQTEKTNKDGTATFNNVEAGNHTINIAYNNYQGEQSINLTGDVKEFNINVTVQQKPILLSPLAYGIIGILVLIIALLSFKIIKSKKQRSLAISE
jgi:LysM repeat protein